jgi:hypothetical protein
MSKDLRNIIIGLTVLLLLLTGAFLGGWSSHKKYRPCPIITSDTIIIHDTVTHHIVDSFPYYIATLDTIFLPDTILQPVDTSSILKNYFSTFVYNREWKDSIINVNLTDYISQNRPVKNEFSYKVIKPFTTIVNQIDNSVTYQSYFQLGITEQLNHYENVGLNAQFVMPKWYLSYGYVPNTKVHSVGIGVTLFKLRKVR